MSFRLNKKNTFAKCLQYKVIRPKWSETLSISSSKVRNRCNWWRKQVLPGKCFWVLFSFCKNLREFIFYVFSMFKQNQIKKFSCPDFSPDRLHTHTHTQKWNKYYIFEKKSLGLDFNIFSGLSVSHMRKLSCIYFFDFYFLILKSPEFCFQDGQK